MKNKFNITDDFLLEDISKPLIRERMDKIPLSGDIKYNFEYLKKINKYLFQDVYDEQYINPRLNIDDINKIDSLLKTLENTSSLDDILNILYQIWEYQIFIDGNTRTLISLLKIYLISIKQDHLYNFNQTISSGKFK